MFDTPKFIIQRQGADRLPPPSTIFPLPAYPNLSGPSEPSALNRQQCCEICKSSYLAGYTRCAHETLSFLSSHSVDGSVVRDVSGHLFKGYTMAVDAIPNHSVDCGSVRKTRGHPFKSNRVASDASRDYSGLSQASGLRDVTNVRSSDVSKVPESCCRKRSHLRHSIKELAKDSNHQDSPTDENYHWKSFGYFNEEDKLTRKGIKRSPYARRNSELHACSDKENSRAIELQARSDKKNNKAVALTAQIHSSVNGVALHTSDNSIISQFDTIISRNSNMPNFLQDQIIAREAAKRNNSVVAKPVTSTLANVEPTQFRPIDDLELTQNALLLQRLAAENPKAERLLGELFVLLGDDIRDDEIFENDETLSDDDDEGIQDDYSSECENDITTENQC